MSYIREQIEKIAVEQIKKSGVFCHQGVDVRIVKVLGKTLQEVDFEGDKKYNIRINIKGQYPKGDGLSEERFDIDCSVEVKIEINISNFSIEQVTKQM